MQRYLCKKTALSQKNKTVLFIKQKIILWYVNEGLFDDYCHPCPS